MRLQVLDAYSDGAHNPNEDSWGCTKSAGWVIDGASSLNKEQYISPGGDTSGMVQVAQKSFQQSLDLPEVDFSAERDAVASAATAIDAWMAGHSKPAGYVPPSAAVSIVGLSQETLHCFGLGDVVAYYLDESDRCTTFDNPKLRVKEYKSVSKFGGRLDGIRAKSAMRQTRRQKMNRPGGYWILANSPKAAQHGRKLTIPAKRGGSLLIASDGFARCIDTYRIFLDPAEMMYQALQDNGLSAIVSQIRQIERQDPDCIEYPRPSPKDDATAVLFQII